MIFLGEDNEKDIESISISSIEKYQFFNDVVIEVNELD